MQTVPYTFDQGRDFLRAHQIIREGDIAVFGPPTGGPTGLSHGVWWYYELTIPYILTGGHPAGFYWFIFLVNAVSVLLFALFLRREWGRSTAVMFLAIIAASPYFVFSSFFPINSVMTIPFILLLYYSLYYVIKQGTPRHIFFMMIASGFILEAEVPFGLFLYPALILSLLFIKCIRKLITGKSRRSALIAGFFIPFIPRLLAEAVSGLRQTKGFIAFLLNSSEPIDPGANLLLERYNLFWDYYRSAFPLRNETVAWIVLGTAAIGLLIGFVSRRFTRKKYLAVTVLIPLFIFVLSLFSNKQLFWANYLEGIQYMLIMPILAAWYVLYTHRNQLIRLVGLLLPLLIAGALVVGVHAEWNKEGGVPLEGLRRHIAALAPIYDAERKSASACVRVYTPPVIPHTYNYLFAYNKLHGKTTIVGEPVDDTCWFVLEKDSCVFKPIEVTERLECESRQRNWKNNQINVNSVMLRSFTISDDVRIEQWKLNR